MCDFPTPQLPTSVTPQIGPFLLQDQSYYKVVAQMSALAREEGQAHQDYKPHLVETVRLAEDKDGSKYGERLECRHALEPAIE